MRSAMLVAAVQSALLRRNYGVLVFHGASLGGLALLTLTRLREASDDAAVLALTLLLFAAAAAAPATIAVYAISGERARGTLEPLLLLPLAPHALLIGKAFVVVVVACAELATMTAVLHIAAAIGSDLRVLEMLRSPILSVVALVGAPLLAVLLTPIVLAISAGARDAQAASNLVTLAVLPVTLATIGGWIIALSRGALPVVALILVVVLLCMVAFRYAAGELSDERLIARRG